MTQKTVVVICGPSLSGKTTLAHMLRNFYGYRHPETTTSRELTEAEQKDATTRHLSKVEIVRLQNAGQAIFVTKEGSELSTITTDAVERVFLNGKTPIIECTPMDAMKIRALAPKLGWETFCIYIDIPRTVVAKRLSSKIHDKDRLKEILVEESGWRNGFEYDYIIDLSLSEDNSFDEMITDIVDAINNSN